MKFEGICDRCHARREVKVKPGESGRFCKPCREARKAERARRSNNAQVVDGSVGDVPTFRPVDTSVGTGWRIGGNSSAPDCTDKLRPMHGIGLQSDLNFQFLRDGQEHPLEVADAYRRFNTVPLPTRASQR